MSIVEVPRNTSKILANVKREDNRAEVRAKTFLQDNSATNLRKGGTIEKKDLSKSETTKNNNNDNHLHL